LIAIKLLLIFKRVWIFATRINTRKTFKLFHI